MGKDNGARLKKWFGIATGIFAVLGFFYELLTGGTLLNLIKFRSHEITSTPATHSFSVTTLKDRLKRNLEPGDRFSYMFGIPLVAQGFIDIELVPDEVIWVVLIDNFGMYFPQYPTVQIYNDNQWKATNIRPLNDITDILFIKVDKAGNAELQKTIDEGKYQTKRLPFSAEELGRIELK